MGQEGVYSEGKMVWWLLRDNGIKNPQLPEAPKQVQLILSDLCNQDCSFCAYRMSGYTSNQLFIGTSERSAYGHDNPKRWIPTDRALSLLDEFKEAGALSVQFTGGGEPTVHPDHERIFEKALSLGLRCSLVSNGVRWSYTLPKDILPRFDWVRISVDSGDPASYARIRNTPRGNWHRAWENIRMLSANVRKTDSPTQIGLGFVVTPDSYREIPAFTALAKDAGVHNIRYTALFSTEDEKPFLPIYDEIRLLTNRARETHQDETFTVYDNFGSRFSDLAQKSPDYGFCSYQYYTTYIGGDMRVYRCCVLAYNERGLIPGGDLSRRSFAEFWKSQERKDDLAALNPRGCPRCQFNAKNRQLLYVIGNTESDAAPRHMEWP